jgi:hypothetical protein
MDRPGTVRRHAAWAGAIDKAKAVTARLGKACSNSSPARLAIAGPNVGPWMATPEDLVDRQISSPYTVAAHDARRPAGLNNFSGGRPRYSLTGRSNSGLVGGRPWPSRSTQSWCNCTPPPTAPS